MSDRKVAVIAIGGNSLIKDKRHQSVEDQYLAAKETAYHIVDMIEAGWDVSIGHGNGPQVGFILRRSEIANKTEGMHEVPLDVAVRTPKVLLATPCSRTCRTSCADAALRNRSRP